MALAHSPKIVTDGLVLYLDAANQKSYPGSGTDWFGLTNNNDGTLVGGVTYSTDNKGILVFDGIDNYVSLSSIISAKPFTISFWCKVDTIKSNCFYCSRTIIGKGVSIFGLATSFIRFDTGDDQWTTSYAITTGQWFQATLSVNASNKNLYINGEFHSSSAYTATINNISPTVATIGSSQIDGASIDNYLDGSLSNYSIYNRAITESEVLQNYNALKGRYGL
jgi:hypothetical protein